MAFAKNVHYIWGAIPLFTCGNAFQGAAPQGRLGIGFPWGTARSRIASVQVTVWYFADCPNWRAAGQRLRQALDEIGRADVPISFAPVETDAQAAELGFAGSPTFTVDGVDLFDIAAPGGVLACRIYPTAAGLAGVPEVSDLVAALTKKVTS